MNIDHRKNEEDKEKEKEKKEELHYIRDIIKAIKTDYIVS